jgi:hypothetical protein
MISISKKEENSTKNKLEKNYQVKKIVKYSSSTKKNKNRYIYYSFMRGS